MEHGKRKGWEKNRINRTHGSSIVQVMNEEMLNLANPKSACSVHFSDKLVELHACTGLILWVPNSTVQEQVRLSKQACRVLSRCILEEHRNP